ncbi:MAG: hypothetical protein EA412_02235 [Chitinophagaceae bacterium]|nr:MAG: hypothetical protein EA412_02235 [Chitinophagaceae bacterium]
MINQFLSKIVPFAFSLLLFLGDFMEVKAQTYDDGPMQLQVRVRDVQVTYSPPSDASLNFGGQVGFNPDNFTFFFWARDAANVSGSGWQGGTCLTDDFDPPNFSQDLNYTMFDETYTGATVPQFFDLRMDAWENDCGTDGIPGTGALGNCQGDRCVYQTNCCCSNVPLFGCAFSTDDDYPCFADPFQTDIDYRVGPPCEWYNHGYLSTTNCANTVFLPRVESFWRYTLGEDCSNPIELGQLEAGVQLSHFNSNVCYSNSFGTPGNDVVYSFEVNEPKGVSITACGGAGSFNRHLYLVNSACNTIIAVDSGACPLINYPICIPGTYKVILSGTEASDAGTFTLTANVNQALTYDLDLVKSDISCAGADDGSIIALPTGGTPPYVDYSWSAPITSSDSVVTDLTAGLYTLTVTDSEGCEISDTIEILEPAALVIDSIAALDVSCGGADDGEAEVFAQGGTGSYSYLWSTAPIQQVTNPAIFLTAGNYSVTVTDQNNCEASSTVEIGTSSPITINLDSLSNVTCFGANDGRISVSVDGGESPYNYLWSNGSSSPLLAAIGPGVYDLTITDADGCIEEASFTINEPSELQSTILSSLDISCNGGNDGLAGVVGSGGTPPYSYLWSNGNVQELLINAEAGSYGVTITDANNCEVTDSITLNEPDPIITDIAFTDPDCDASDPDNGTISLNISGGSGSFDVLWSNGSNNMDLFDLSGGLYIAFVTDSENCIAIDSVSLELCDLPSDTVIIPGDTIIIPGDTDEYFVSVPNAFAPDGSGQNTHFNVMSSNARSIEINIFNRWGESVYFNQNLLNTSNGWDGTHKGTPSPMGSYVYHIKVEYLNGNYREKTGNVLLIR